MGTEIAVKLSTVYGIFTFLEDILQRVGQTTAVFFSNLMIPELIKIANYQCAIRVWHETLLTLQWP